MLNRNLLASLLSLALLAGASAAHAQANRTWVSGTGDDVNPCSRTAPCKTFAGAIIKTNAGGTINVLDPASYGTLTITKSITVEAEQYAGVLTPFVSGFIVNAASTDIVTIRGLSFDGMGTGLNGVRILQAKQVHIENCTIQSYAHRGIYVDNSSTDIQLFVRNTVIRNHTGSASPAGNSGAILLRPTGTGSVSALLDHVALDQNTFGLLVEANARATVSDSTASANTDVAIHATSPGSPDAASIILERVTLSNNTTAVLADGSAFASVRLSNTLITSNSTGLSSAGGGQILSFGNNSVEGNGTNGVPTSAVTPQI